MKKFFAVMLVLCFAFCAMAKDVKVPVAVKQAVTTEVVYPAVMSSEDWSKITAPAVKLNAEGKFLEASDAYLQAGEYASHVKDGWDKIRQAWMFNNAGYMIINVYKNEKKTEALTLAQLYLDKSTVFNEKNDAQLNEKIASNKKFITDEMVKLVPKSIKK